MKSEKLVQIEEKEMFADPTYDVTFKMLFGTEKNKDILISLLNNLLDFKGGKEIIDVTINSSDLDIEGVSDIKGAVDVLCTTKNHQKIAVEMQRKYKDYFLPRSQEYMSKIIASQVKEGEGQNYDTAIMDTYILAIGKQNIFRGKYELTDKKLFEVTVVPMIVETREEMPGNKMHWKFFELPKFEKFFKHKVINATNSLKEQWLDFLIKCNEQTEIPDNINDIIKKGYNVMKTANWDENQRLLYWKQKSNEREEIKEQKMLEKMLEEKAFKDGLDEGILKGIQKEKARGIVKNEISNIKFGIENELAEEKIVKKLNYTKPYFQVIQEHLNNGHFDDTESVIGDNLHLFDMDIEY